ncbi:MAG: hypothetical protein MJ061_02980, partial [Mailhella sp.]|nr:hypothetical protein [Mailhella sp.]
MKRILAAAAALAMLAAPICLGTAHAAPDFTGLSFHSEYGESHPAVANVFRPFFSAAKARFPEKLGFEYVMNNDLFPPAEAFTAPGAGKVDFASIRIAMFPGRCPLLGAVNLPGTRSSAVVGSRPAHDLLETSP